jgi:heme oxygenase
VFDQLDNGVQFKKRYRQQLDDATWDEEQTDRIVAEARRAFQLNLAMFESLLEPQAAPVT